MPLVRVSNGGSPSFTTTTVSVGNASGTSYILTVNNVAAGDIAIVVFVGNRDQSLGSPTGYTRCSLISSLQIASGCYAYAINVLNSSPIISMSRSGLAQVFASAFVLQ